MLLRETNGCFLLSWRIICGEGFEFGIKKEGLSQFEVLQHQQIEFPEEVKRPLIFTNCAHVLLQGKWRKGDIYCSPLTAQILPLVTRPLRRRCKGVSSNVIRPLELNRWHQMDGFSVMLVDANHVPGSVMFIFEGERIPEGRILFTGDFRADARFYANKFVMTVLQEVGLYSKYSHCHTLSCNFGMSTTLPIQ